jgi:hypothetical protein
MINHFYTDRLISVHLACQVVNQEYSLISEQVYLLTDAFDRKIKLYTRKQLLFLKAFLTLQHDLEGRSTDSLIEYQLFLIEEQLKKQRI